MSRDDFFLMKGHVMQLFPSAVSPAGRPTVQPTSGFSLVELMIVVTIITVLVSMTVVALKMVKVSAQRLGCTNNVRQLVMSSLTYANDYDGFLPPYNADTTYYYLSGNFYVSLTNNNDTTHRLAYGTSDLTFFRCLWSDYMNSPKALFCPRMRGSYLKNWGTSTWGGKASYIFRFQKPGAYFGTPYIASRANLLNPQAAMIYEPTLLGYSTHGDEFSLLRTTQYFFGGSQGFPDGHASFIMPGKQGSAYCCTARF